MQEVVMLHVRASGQGRATCHVEHKCSQVWQNLPRQHLSPQLSGLQKRSQSWVFPATMLEAQPSPFGNLGNPKKRPNSQVAPNRATGTERQGPLSIRARPELACRMIRRARPGHVDNLGQRVKEELELLRLTEIHIRGCAASLGNKFPFSGWRGRG